MICADNWWFFDRKFSPLKLRDLQVLKRESEEIENEEGFGHPPDNAIPADEMERPAGGSLMERMASNKDVCRDVFCMSYVKSILICFENKWKKRSVNRPFWWLLLIAFSFVAIYMLLFEWKLVTPLVFKGFQRWMTPSISMWRVARWRTKIGCVGMMGGLAGYFNSWI